MRIDNFVLNNTLHNCVGCFACKDACPKKCINIKTDAEGFLYASVEEENCVNCGKCSAVCPCISAGKNDDEQILFAAHSKSDDVRMRGSSGGMFEEICKLLLKEGYYICGAAFDDNLQLKHKIISSYEDLKPLLKSKYLQSDTSGIFFEIHELLKEDKKVLFCGTPCQVSALRNYVGKNNDGLVTVDIICHGVPSQKFFDEYIKTLEKENEGKITEFSFRVKNNKYRHAHGFEYCVDKNGKSEKISGVYTQSTYYNAFKKYLIFRKSCYSCKYATLNRVSDITLGDFWSLEKYDVFANTDKGESLVLANTSLGRKILEKVNDVKTKQYPVKCAIDTNYCLTKHTKQPKLRDEILNEFKENGYKAIADKYFSGSNGLKNKLVWAIPPALRNLLRVIRGKINV